MTCCPTCGAKIAVPKPMKDDAPLRAFLAAWYDRFGTTPVSARELHELSDGLALHRSITRFGVEIGNAWRAGTVVNGHRAALVKRGWSETRGRTKTRKGTNVIHPTLWALEEAPASDAANDSAETPAPVLAAQRGGAE